MKNRYIDLIVQTFDWPVFDLSLDKDELLVYGIKVSDIVERFGSPLKVFYLPKIRGQIDMARTLFAYAMNKLDYKGTYTFCYCTKSSHFSFVLDQVLAMEGHLETSSAFDMYLIKSLFDNKKLPKDRFILCNGYKVEEYKKMISDFLNAGFDNVVPILDNMDEIDYYNAHVEQSFTLGLRIAAEEEPNFSFYTSRLGIRYKDLKSFYLQKIRPNKKANLKMLHFFINTGIRDTAYYWNELNKCIQVYCDLWEVCETLDSLDIGGGFPVANSLNFEFDYEYMVYEILSVIKARCDDRGVPVPNIFTEFGSYTVAESAFNIFTVLGEKDQNDAERWYMVNGSFINSMPDVWAIDQRYILLAANNWENEYQRVNLGGLTCDSMDYYNSEAHLNQIFLPKLSRGKNLHLIFLNTGAYQESLSGYGGIKHCLIPASKILLIDQVDGDYSYQVFREAQRPQGMLEILGY
ncbi:MAG: arginine decarboxylase [Bacteroidetes bacterium]|jgi:arginine decarboxylase|nr:arginine decarboxylase [Bacteroidota bacterium]